MSSIVRKLLLVLVGLIVGVSAGMGYGAYKLNKERNAHEHVVKEFEKKTTQAQHNLGEQKNRVVNLEGRNRSLQSQITKLEGERDSLAADAKELDEKLQLSAAKIKELVEAQAAVKNDCSAVEKKCAEVVQSQVNQVVKRCESAVAQINGQKDALESALKNEKEAYGKCAGNNRELCSIAKEILGRYENKGFFTKVMEKEPFTQIKKVELEKLVQEYDKKIDENRVKTEKAE